MTNKYSSLIAQLGAKYGYYASRGAPLSLSEAQLDDLENQIEARLPTDYREFIRDYGGYVIGDSIFPIQDESDELSEAVIDTFYGHETLIWLCTIGRQDHLKSGEYYTLDWVSGITLVKELESGETRFQWPDELLPIGCDLGGNQICLAVGGLRPGAVFWWRNALFEGYQNLYLVANTFDEFLRSINLEETAGV